MSSRPVRALFCCGVTVAACCACSGSTAQSGSGGGWVTVTLPESKGNAVSNSQRRVRYERPPTKCCLPYSPNLLCSRLQCGHWLLRRV